MAIIVSTQFQAASTPDLSVASKAELARMMRGKI